MRRRTSRISDFQFQKQLTANTGEAPIEDEIIDVEAHDVIDLRPFLYIVAAILIPILFVALYCYGFAYIIHAPPFGPTPVGVGTFVVP